MKIDKETEKPVRRRPKKAKGHAAHHGGAWKVAYADFVTAMMALFLVLWLVSQADTKLKQAIANYFRSPGVFDTMQGGILSQAKKISKEPENLTSKDDEQALFAAAKSIQKQFNDRPEFSKYKEQVKVEVTEEGLRIQLVDKAERFSFPSGSAEVTADARAILAQIAISICSLPNKINIGGHTDSKVFGSNNGYTNWELSADRANAARRVLESNCVKPEQIRRIVGFADTEPMDPADPYSPANRRISITVTRLTGPTIDKSAEGQTPAEKPAGSTSNNLPDQTVPKANTPTNSLENRIAEKKLENQGKVVVGEPDKVPGRP